MTIRLRSGPPRRRRGRAAPLFGLAAVATLAAAMFTLRGGGPAPSVRIERITLPPSTLPASSREVDGTLVSLPPLAPPRPFLTDHRIVSFYGNPLTEILGVLGQQSPQETVKRLRAQADAYARISNDRTVVPAMHLIYAVAQSFPGEDGTYLQRTDDAVVEQYVRLTRDNGMLLFLDIQMGRSTVEAELPHIYKFLVNEHVHVALDPEFAWGPNGAPNDDIGHLTGAQINVAQAMLQRFTIEHKLPTKILVVHQFLPGMVKQKEEIKRYDRIELVFDADGFGPRQVKKGAWDRVIVDDNVELAGIKLFYRQDIDLMTPADVLALDPKPVIIIYQ